LLKITTEIYLFTAIVVLLAINNLGAGGARLPSDVLGDDLFLFQSKVVLGVPRLMAA
jgi:hypothetical protein